MDDIAVVGVGLRFPGDAASPEELWSVLERGESQWSEFPKDRLNIDGYYHPGGDRQGSISFKGGHFLRGDVAAFDAPFFSVAADDAKAIDPQQRFLLEVSYEALENAGIRKEDIDGSDTAVYVGSFVKDYEQICLRDPDWQPQYAATGNGIAIMANRISYAFNLHGPSVTVDTGCSGSLVSVHLAAQSLRSGESSLAIAAGAGMILTPNTIMPMTALNFLSPDGKCFTFDSRANGYGRGEGIGVVVLKRLSDAVRDNDTIRAVIRGSRVNQDGRTTGITLPSKEAQVANIRALYESSGLSFDQTAYVECHGTGTQAGDWRELKAVSETLGSIRHVDNPIVVGSLKTNIGHLEGAAGVAGLIKGVLMLERGKIPPNINFQTPNPDIDFADWKVKVPRGLMEWPLSGLRRVSVNCFGFGGTNAHVIMDDAATHLKSRALKGNHMSVNGKNLTNGTLRSTLERDPMPQLFCFSANEKAGVQRVLDSQIPYIESAEKDAKPDFLANYAYTLGCRRSLLEWKGAIVASSAEDLVARMRSIDADSLMRSSGEKQPRICFVFCGQGSQWAQMGQDLLPFTAFRESLEAASRHLTTLQSSFILMDEIFKPEGKSRISHPEISQPATTALQVALVELLASMSVRPTHVVGHSSGEIAAAFASGAISRETAWEIAYYRGLSAGMIPLKAPKLEGGMIAVGMSEQECREYLISVDQPAQVACINSPRSVTVSGQADAINFIAQDLKEKNIFHRVLPVKTAYHSEHMTLVADDYERALGDIKAQSTGAITMFSSLTGRAIEGTNLNGSYWVQNMVSPVQYLAAVRQMMGLSPAERPSILVELSPRATLRSPTMDILAGMDIKATPGYRSTLDGKTCGMKTLLQLIGDLWTRGLQIDIKSVINRATQAPKLKCLVDIPPYPWNHSKSYWHESHLGRANRFREYPRQDLIGAPTADSIPFEPRWRGFLRISENPWIQDHQVQKTIIYPASGMVSMVLEGAKQMAQDQNDIVGYEIANMRLEKAMLIPSTAHGLEMALNIKRDMDHTEDVRLTGSHEFSIYTKNLDGPWEKNATGLLRFQYRDVDHDASIQYLSDRRTQLAQSCTESVTPRQLYELLDTVGMNYGPLFQNIVKLHKGDGSCVADVRIPDTKSKMPAKFEYPHLIHPATLDSMFQTLFAIEPVPMVPTFIESLFVSSDLDQGGSGLFSGYSTAQRTGLGGAKANITMQRAGTDSHVIINGLHLSSIAGPSPEKGGFLPNHRNLCTEIVWKEEHTLAYPKTLVEHLDLLSHKFPDLSILQVGGGWDVSSNVLEQLFSDAAGTPRLARYTIADTGDDSGREAMRRLENSNMLPYVQLAKIDGSEPLAEYHCILVLTLDGVKVDILHNHLKPGGWMVQNNAVISNGSLNGIDSLEKTVASDFGTMTARRKAGSLSSERSLSLVLLCTEECRADADDFKEALVSTSSLVSGLLEVDLQSNIDVMSLDEMAQDTSRVSGKIVVSMLDFAGPLGSGGFVHDWTAADFDAFHAIQKAAESIVWITRGAHMEPSNPKTSPIIALARTLMSEDPQKVFVTLDLGADSPGLDSDDSLTVWSVLVLTFLQDSVSGPRDMEFAVKDGKLYIPRLVTVTGLNKLIESNGSLSGTTEVPFASDPSDQSRRGLKLEIAEHGISNDSFHFVEFEHPQLQPNQVEVEFRRAILTFRDLEVVLGHTSDLAIGLDFVGRVTRLGENVSEDKFQIGDPVAALVPDGSLQNMVNVDARFLTPARRGFIPSAFVSAYYALVHVGRIRGGRKVLIHAGASCFGRAAIAVCSVAGADFLVTVLEGDSHDSDKQREILQAQGLRAEQIIDSNSPNFAATVKEATGGKGVDVVYNPTQENVDASAECIRPGGIIVQFQDRSSIPKNRKRAPTSGTYINFDLGQLMKDDPEFVAKMLQRTVFFLDRAGVEFGADANTAEEHEIGNLVTAFENLELSPYIGYTSVVARADAADTVPVLATDTTKPLREAVDPSGTYVLAGGLGGLGRSISELLISAGAQNLAFLSRSGVSSEQAKEFFRSLDDRGINVRVYRVDICDAEALADVVGNTISAEMPPIRGVFQCAAVIKDSVFDNMSYQDWCTAFRPKAMGSWNLVEAADRTGSDPFFIFLASSAGVIGNRGQANYAAGNFFEDALARSLRLKGRHAVSIDLGPILGAGMLAEDEEILDMLRASGFYGIRHEDFLKIVKHAITMETLPGVPMPPQVTLGVGTGGLILQNQPADPYWSRTALYSYLNLVDMPPPDLTKDSSAGPARDVKGMLACSPDAEAAAEIVCNGLMHMLAKAMNMLFEEMDAGKPPNAYGVDSLVAVGVRNWVFSNCSVQVSVFEVLSDKTVGELAAVIVERGGFGAKE